MKELVVILICLVCGLPSLAFQSETKVYKYLMESVCWEGYACRKTVNLTRLFLLFMVPGYKII